jgi:hypothetical protein
VRQKFDTVPCGRALSLLGILAEVQVRIYFEERGRRVGSTGRCRRAEPVVERGTDPMALECVV